MASFVVPANQSKRVYTNSSGGAATVNVHAQVLSNTANTCFSIKAINNCCIDSTTLENPVALVKNYVGTSSTLSCCGIGCDYPQLHTFFNQSDHSVCAQIENGQIANDVNTAEHQYSFCRPCQYHHIQFIKSDGCTLFPEHWNGGVANAGLEASTFLNEKQNGRGCICGAHGHGIFPRRGGSTYSMPDAETNSGVWGCFNYVMGVTKLSCCTCFGAGARQCFNYCCSCGSDHKWQVHLATCFAGCSPDYLFCYQVVDACNTNAMPGSAKESWCNQYGAVDTEFPSALTYVTFEPYQGVGVGIGSGIGGCFSAHCCFVMWGLEMIADCSNSGSKCLGPVMTCELNCYGCKFHQRLQGSGQAYKPFLVTNGALVRNVPCTGCDCCASATISVWEPGTKPSLNLVREAVRSLHGMSRLCGACGLFFCLPMSYFCSIKWLQWNPTDNNIYIQMCTPTEGGIYTINWLGGNPTAGTCNIVTGSGGNSTIGNPVTEMCGIICARCVDHDDLHCCMKNCSPYWFQHMAKDCFVGQWGNKVFRSSDLVTWTELCAWACNTNSTFCELQTYPGSYSCYFSTDGTCYCYSKNCYVFMDCSGVFEHCSKANQLERTGVVLSNNDSLYVNNESNNEVSVQVYGYEDGS